jgi:pimeloyl-ACP methyl ester carboxylesterase
MALVLGAGALSIAASPAPFTEEVVVVGAPGAMLSGTLTIPAGKGPFPVALIIAGSGPTDRDGNSAYIRTDAYKLLAQELAVKGIATLRYDKRGVGASPTSQTEDQMRFGDFVNDALALTRYLETRGRFSSVSIIGHSEGSLIGILAAQRDPSVKAFVSLEGLGRNVATVLEEQYRASGAAPATVNEVVAYDKLLMAGKTIPSPDPRLSALFRPSVQPYLISWYRYDPATEVAKLKIPVLIVQGTNDLQASMADANRLAAADPQAKLATVQGMNHILRDAPADRQQNLATYTNPALPLNAQVVTVIASFLLAL